MRTVLQPMVRAAGHELRLAAVALQFLTRVPMQLAGFQPGWLHASARHFPLVGALIGAAAGAVLWAAARWWPDPVAVLLALAAAAWLTGGLHEDGLADTCDALGGTAGREEALRIMKDPRLGSHGALGLGLTLALKAAALWALLLQQGALPAAAALLLAHTASRAAAVALPAALAYAGDPALARSPAMTRPAGAARVAVAVGWVAAVAATLAAGGLWPAAALAAALAGAAAVTAACARWFQRRLGGYTGDTLGATQQWSELAVYLALAAAG